MVVLFKAQQIIHYSGDPLKDFAGIRFLDRFVFKNPKRRVVHDDDHQGVKKVKGSHPKFAIRKNYVPRGLKSVAVNSASYLNEDAKKIPVDEKFLYDFLQQRRAATRLDADGDGDEDSDAASVASEDFERYLDSLTGAPPAAADSDEELDYLGELEAAKQKTVVRKRKAAADDLDQLDDDLSNGDEDDDDGDLVMSGDDEEPSLSGDERDRGGDNLGSLFASAEEFSTLLEESATSWKQGSSGAVSNKDNSSLQQLAWEEKRDTWIKGGFKGLACEYVFIQHMYKDKERRRMNRAHAGQPLDSA
ncbi:unnamed protein product [Diatraea saccharalis]|uniref:Uncharacterized protein n=1 Tax=Diatraea saccharalis TaxID=40085 RepID=A0A9N9WDC3_9NEOP|nr:unnamed protein product [Diatraea saccharalis]